MTELAAGLAQRGGRLGGRVGHAVGRFWSGISAVSIKELRGRMRGRRAFVVLTIYLLLLGLFAFAIYVYLKQQAATAVLNTRAHAKERIGTLIVPQGREQGHADGFGPGDIGAVAKLKETRAGDWL